MAGFGDDVSMSDFTPPQGEGKEHEDQDQHQEEDDANQEGAGHTSDASVLNVGMPPPRDAFAGGFGPGMVDAERERVRINSVLTLAV